VQLPPDTGHTSPSNTPALALDRRDFLRLAIAALAMPLLPGCDNAPPPVAGRETPLPTTAFDVLRELVASLRQSPDHLPARLTRLVQARDWRAIHAFVRDEIETWPSGANDFNGDNARSVRWGALATLRGGAGTPREKADLLAQALADAGFSARVVQARTRYGPEAVARLLQPRARTFAPPLDAATLAQWRKILGRSGNPPLPAALDPDDIALEALLERLLGVIGTEPRAWASARGFDFRWRPGLALVVVETSAGRFLLNPVDPAQAPQAEGPSPLPEAGPAIGLITVEASLEAATVDDPRKRQVLVSGQWDASQLAGRNLVVATPPTVAPNDWANTRIADIQSYLPVLRVVDGGRDPALAALAVHGDPFTRRAERLVVDDAGRLHVGDVVLGEAAPDALARVQALRAKVAGVAHGEASLVVDALDAAGQPVVDLDAGAFTVTVDGEARGFLMLSNRPRVEVGILIDQSMSMPGDYQGPAGEAWVERTRRQVLAVAPHAVIRVVATGSKLWESLAAESARGGDLLVYLTDGDVDGQANDRLLATLDKGPPALVVAVRDNRRDVLGALAAATHGQHVAATDEAAASAAIAAALAERAAPAYRFRLEAQGLAPGMHEVAISTRDGRVNAALPLELPEGPAALPPRICGLYLKLRIGDVQVERTLAGLDARLAGRRVPTAEDLDAVEAALLAGACVVFEAAAPSPAIWLDDVASSRLPMESVIAEMSQASPHAAFERLVGDFQPLPAMVWQTGLLPLDALPGEPLGFHAGLRAVLLAAPLGRDGRRVSRVDILPVSRFATAVADPRQAVRTTLRRTARLAQAEAAYFGTSTLSLLEGKTLGLMRRDLPAIRALDPGRRLSWNEALRDTGQDWIVGDAAAGPLAFFQVSRRSGELLAVLPDGSGGGSQVEDMVAFADKLKTVMDLYEAATWTPSGAIHGAPGLSAVAAWGQVLARLYAAVTVTIAMLGVEGQDEQSRRLIQRLACKAVDIVAKGPFGKTDLTERMRELVGVLVGAEGACG